MVTTLLATLALLGPQQSAPLIAQTPIVVPGGAGHFDFMGYDEDAGLVLACHPGKSSFAVVDLATGVAKDVDAGVEVNGIAADSKNKRIYAAGPGKTLVCFDSSNWTKVGALPLEGPGDCVQYDSKRGVVYVDNDDGTNLWVVDAKTLKLVGTVAIKEAPEYMEFDKGRDRIFQAIKSASVVQVIDPEARKVVAEYTLGELTSPHGLALDRKLGRIFVAGKNGKLVILDADSGKLLQTIDVVKGSDQIAYDRKLKRVYVPGQGQIQVIQIDADGGKLIGSVPVNPDTHRIAIDRKTSDVWVAYSDSSGSYFQKFTVAK